MKEIFKDTAFMDVVYSVVNTKVYGIDRILDALDWIFRDNKEKLDLIQSCVVHRQVGFGTQYLGTVYNLKRKLLPLIMVDDKKTVVSDIKVINDKVVYNVKKQLATINGEEFYVITDIIAAVIYNPIISFERKLQAICYIIINTIDVDVDSVYQLLVDEKENLDPDNFIFNTKLSNLRKRIHKEPELKPIALTSFNDIMEKINEQ